jgi:hypothetical protein
MTTTTAPTPLIPIEDTETAAWLEQTVRHDRERVAEGPTAAAIDRIRARVFSETTERRRTSKIAA